MLSRPTPVEQGFKPPRAAPLKGSVTILRDILSAVSTDARRAEALSRVKRPATSLRCGPVSTKTPVEQGFKRTGDVDH